MVLKLDFKKLIISLAIPLLVGGFSALITSDNMDIYSKIVKPPLSPPALLFPIVWTALYTLMGISFYLVLSSSDGRKNTAINLFFVQLFLNFIWSPIFFNNRWFLVSLIVLVFLWIVTFLMIIVFYKTLRLAGLLQIPYIIWLTFAMYLNFAIYLLN
ncbi:MAG: tryptophan-rich sensory protein [Clostridia bacterium]|nr:tryptophan-rich sensory protein [Clostridia bacterium]